MSEELQIFTIVKYKNLKLIYFQIKIENHA